MAKATKAPQDYRGNGNHTWEQVTEGTMRLRVPGGWLFSTYNGNNNIALAFVPMPEVVKHKV